MNDIFSNPILAKALPEAIIETLQMVGISSFFTVLIGLPLGVFLHVSAPGGSARCRSPTGSSAT